MRGSARDLQRVREPGRHVALARAVLAPARDGAVGPHGHVVELAARQVAHGAKAIGQREIGRAHV